MRRESSYEGPLMLERTGFRKELRTMPQSGAMGDGLAHAAVEGGRRAVMRLIAMDYDFTLIDYGPNGASGVDAQLLAALAELVRAGIRAGIVTGRAFDGLPETLARAGIEPSAGFPSFLICQDAYLYRADGQGGFTEDGEANAPVRREATAHLRRALPAIGACLEALERAELMPRAWRVVGDFGAELEMASPEEARRGMELVRDPAAGLTLNRNHHLINLMPPIGGKGQALARYAQALALAPHQVLAVGDSLNDLTMLDGRHGFCAGTVANGDPLVKAAVRRSGGHISALRAGAGTLDCLRHYGLA